MNAAMNPNKALWEKGERVQVAGKVTLELPKHAPNKLSRFRQLWVAVNGRARPSTGLCHVAERRAPRGAPGTNSFEPSH
jgi:hypothetical protein